MRSLVMPADSWLVLRTHEDGEPASCFGLFDDHDEAAEFVNALTRGLYSGLETDLRVVPMFMVTPDCLKLDTEELGAE